VKASANLIILNSLTVLNERQFRNYLSEPKSNNEKGALDNPIESADGNEMFVRLSAFEDDKNNNVEYEIIQIGRNEMILGFDAFKGTLERN